MEITIKWKEDTSTKWQDFYTIEAAHMPRNHFLSLFKNKLAVIAKCADEYFVNREELRDQYRKQGRKCKLFSECEPSEGQLRYVGFN